MAIYPNLPPDIEVRLRAVEVAAKGVPDYLVTGECPYSEGLRSMLARMLNVGPAGGVGEIEERLRVFDVVDADKFDVMLREIETTIEEMKSIEGKMGSDADTSDRIALVKAKTSLLEKWATLKERVLTLKEMSQFQSAVISVMDDVLDVDQRAKFRDRLRGFKSVTGMLAVGTGAKVVIHD